MRTMRIAAAAMSLIFGSAWFLFVVPLISAAISAAPMISASKTGFFTWAAWLKDYLFSSVLTLQAFFTMDWLSIGAIAGIGLFVVIVAVILISVLRPRPYRNDIIDAQPPAAGSNEYGNRRWMRTEAEITKELGFKAVEIENIKPGEGGLYCGEFGKKVIIADEDEHMLILAPTRVGKTRRVLLKQIAVLVKSGESFCAFDPKGELFGCTSKFATDNGSLVNRLDLRQPEMGNLINTLDNAIKAYMGVNGQKPINTLLTALDKKYVQLAKLGDGQTAERAKIMADIESIDAEVTERLERAEHEISQVTSFVFPREIEKEGNSKFFNDGAENLIQMTLHYLCSSKACPEHDKGLYTASKLISEFCKPEKLTKSPGEDRIFAPLIEEIHQLPRRHPAYVYMTKIDGSRNLSDFITTATGALARYTSSSIARMMTETDHPFSTLADRPTATYIIVPNDDDTYNSVAMLFVAQMYTALMRRADELGGRLPVRMNMICEELKQLPVIDGLDQKLSICAGFGVRWILVLQSLTQLESAYGRDDAATIMENCRIQLCLQAGTAQTGEYIEKRCGTYTISLKSSSSSKVPQGLMADRSTASESLGKRARCSADEAQTWNPDQGAILLKIGCQPACTPIPELSVTPFNAMLGMGSREHNTEMQRIARNTPVHQGRTELPSWTIELHTQEEANKPHTDEERKKLFAKYIFTLRKKSQTRQSGKAAEDGKQTATDSEQEQDAAAAMDDVKAAAKQSAQKAAVKANRAPGGTATKGVTTARGAKGGRKPVKKNASDDATDDDTPLCVV